MEIPNSLLAGLLIAGVLLALLLWALGVVPWWSALIVAAVAPFGFAALLLFLFYALWIASGSH